MVNVNDPHCGCAGSAHWCLWLLVLIATLTSCTGWPSSVDDSGLPPYKSGGYCVGNRTSHEIKAPSGVGISVQATIDKLHETILLDVNFLVPDAVTMRLQSRDVVLQSPQWAQERRLPVHHIEVYDPNLSAWSVAHNEKKDRLPTVHTLWYLPRSRTLLPQTEIPQVHHLTIRLPAIDIDGVAFQADEIEFRRYRKMGLFGCTD